jgi:hypothetical protein
LSEKPQAVCKEQVQYAMDIGSCQGQEIEVMSLMKKKEKRKFSRI